MREDQRIWRQTPRGIFWMQRSNAKRRGIPWLLTFEEWWLIWRRSKRWTQRGKGRGRYCMSRLGDKGAYATGNVRIVTHQKNSEEHTYRHSEEAKRKIGQARKGNTDWLGKTHTKKTKQKMSRARKKQVPPFLGKHHSEASKELKRAHWRNQYGSAK